MAKHQARHFKTSNKNYRLRWLILACSMTAVLTASVLSLDSADAGKPCVPTTTTVPTTVTTTPTTVTTAPTTTTSPSTTTTSSPVSALRWPAPTLTAPTTVSATGGNLNLTAGKDYIVRLPATTLNKANGVTLTGGRNVVLIGGHITIPSSAAADVNPRRALYLKDQTGTVHVEGLLIDNSGGGLSEGIQINAPQATVQIQNTRITGLRIPNGDLSLNHPDLVQFWGGVKELRIDRLTGSSDYQGLMLKADYRNSQPPVTVSRVNIKSDPVSAAKYLVWIGPSGALPRVTFEDVWITPSTSRSLAKTLWPEPGNTNGPIISGTTATYNGPDVFGVINQGAPPAGDFVPAGTVGLGYASLP